MVRLYYSECCKKRGVGGQRSGSVGSEHSKNCGIICKIVKLIEASFNERNSVGGELLDFGGSFECGCE